MESILNEIKRRREKSFATIKDIKRILEAEKTGDWSKVHASNLYRLHSGEYCELLQLLSSFD